MAIDSDLKICGLAMSWLGANAPTNIVTPVSAEDKVCAANYEASRDAVLEDGEWSFAVERTKLTTPVVVSGEPNKFALPTGVIRMLQAGAQYDFSDRTSWVKEGESIAINLDEVYIRYIKQITDVGFFTPSFIQCLAAHIAAVSAVTMTNSSKVEERRWAIYSTMLGNAIVNDGRVGTNRQLSSDVLSDVRYQYGTGFMGPYV